MNSRNKLAEMPIRPLLYTMAVPLMLSLLVQSLYNIVDSIFVARLSETALTAASLVYSIQFLMIAVGVGTAVGLKNYHFMWQDVADIYRVGLPTIIMQAIGSIMTFVVNRILLDVSATAVAFFGIYYKLQNFLMMPINGLGQAAIPIVGYNYGDKNYQRVHQTWKILLPTGAIIALCGTVIFWCFSGQLLQLFSASSEMLLLVIPALMIISISFVMSAITILCGYFSSGLGNGIINMVGAAIRQLILLVPCLWIFIKISGISHGWYAFWIAEIIACIYSYCMSHKLLKTIYSILPEYRYLQKI